MEASARGELRAKMARRISLGKREGKAMILVDLEGDGDGKKKGREGEQERRRRWAFEVSSSTWLPSSPPSPQAD